MRRLLSMAMCMLAVAGTAALPSGAASASEERESYCAGRGDVYFRAADGTRLIGHRFGGGRTAVVLAHQRRGSLCQWVMYARRLSSQGYMAFAFDFRNNGRSEQVGYRASGRLPGDVAAATKWVRAHGAEKVLLVGASMGGSAVLVGAANIKPHVAGVVSLSGSSGFDVRAALPRLTVPVLYLASEQDAGGGFAQEARTMYEATPSLAKAMEIVPGSSHGVSLVAGPGKARELVEQFLASH
jgi:pimeloyl-ACP methyl ester carboxylesterase